MTLRQKQWMLLLFLLAGLLLLLLYPEMWGKILGLLLFFGAGILQPIWMRCPSCGMHLGRYPGDYCKLCGAKIPWNEKKKRIL